MLGEALQLGKRAATLQPDSRLFGALPELDSMALVLVIVAIEERFGITLDEDEMTARTFETLGSLATLVDRKLAG